MKHPLADCAHCTLNGAANKFVPSTIPPGAKLALVGEAPGKREGFIGRQFVGPQGDILGALVPGGIRNDVMLTTTVLCAPPGNRPATAEEIACCTPRLRAELNQVGVQQVVVMGNIAAHALLDSEETITSLRVGPPKRSPHLRPDVEVIATFHPAFVLRQGEMFPTMAGDFAKLNPKNRKVWREPIVTVFDDITALDALHELLALETAKLVVDIEVGIEKDTDFDHPERYEFLCVGLGYAPGKVAIIGEEALKLPEVVQALAELLWAKEVWCHNGKFDLAGLTGLGIRDVELSGDTMLQSYVADERQGTHRLGDLSIEILGAPDWKHVLDEWVGSGKNKRSYSYVPRPILYKYCGFDVSCTWDLGDYYDELLEETEGFTQLHKDLCKVSMLLQHIETQGLCVDEAYFEQLAVDYLQVLGEQEAFLSKWVANPRSPKQVKEALYDMGVRTDSTDDLHLELILRKVSWESELGKFCLAMRKYRKDVKMYGTYIKGIRASFYEGRLHGNFLLHGTTSGRWACKKPNLLNFPRGRTPKDGIIADPGFVMVQGDLKTAELRVIAIEADCPWLIDVLSDVERDIHGEVATQRYGAGWTKDQRVRAKAVVFGLGYGREAESIAIEYDMTIEEAQSVMREFFALIPEVPVWQEKIRQQVIKGVDLQNAFGRMRRFHLITKQNIGNVRREALSFIPQSTANDINMRAAYAVWKQGGDVRLCVHDSIMCIAREDEANDIAELIKREHQKAALNYSDVVPFFSDTSIGMNWGQLV